MRTTTRIPVALTVGLVIVAVFAVAGVAAPWLAPFDPQEQIAGAHLLAPSGQHWLGTDELNRDVLSRVLFGIRTSLTVMVIAVPIGAVIGVGLAMVATVNRFADTVIARGFDVLLAFPAIVLAITVTAVRGPGLSTVIVAVVLAETPVFGRIARSAATRVRASAFVESSRLHGGSEWWIVSRHIVGNITPQLIVQLSLALSLSIFVESGMSFIGAGVRPPQPSLGSILSEAIYSWDVNVGYAVGPLVTVAALSVGFLLIAQGYGRWSRG
ncbi:ABC transporter permease [Williamsia sp.]|uniref:ABC transporter permease n=1 Tax=Williamsia sp. TaxID=1872085 RepID=UPI0025EDE592|nr:ABC transporter permease [Williamsia sp.]